MLFCVATSSVKAQSPYKNAIKVTFLSWFSGSTKVSYERAFPECKQSGEICASMIGAGYDKYKNNPLGFTVRYGHKFFVAGYNEAKPLMGFYLRPEIMYSHYDYTHSVTKLRTPSRMGTIMATFGISTALSDLLLMHGLEVDTAMVRLPKLFHLNSALRVITMAFRPSIGLASTATTYH